ncbi:MAG: cereblon family protein [Desulfobacterales bacterium]|nr:cereblon family protein [Desulfobacterales bacterium]
MLCRQCLQVITHRSLKIIIHGTHEHTFANPYGIVYEIGCFQSASGCGYVGSPTDEFSWFRGFKWQVAVCASCLTHLGWLFTSSGIDSFIGLILERLEETR